MSLNSGLYLKVQDDKLAGLNRDLLIDLGDELNTVLAALADEEHTVVMVDLRVMSEEGLRAPNGTTFRDVLGEGPSALATTYMRELAGSCDWSKGYAHM